ncbi:inorganic diphosphatase [Ancylobacter amanitiformis]|uniref:Inorganic pyrophosphatase n=1 Tax=Ancylobacter amanitiformis TaxID=217069 RepID=A0ABU0LP20_9HYPH|nr:inorganic diphosphatase [Ancylobacter amanitiformis]MDQ0510419.1 inorganic pyrophosphatase [Ancylobacter amanitiformis]
MDISRISAGSNPPDEINVIIEIPAGGAPVKYELDKESGALFVDRFLHTPMFYPGNYGFIPQTLGDDGDPLDVIVISPIPLLAGCVIAARPVGVLMMTDEKGGDEKILAVPANSVYPYHSGVTNYTDLPPIIVDQVAHFFTHYKDLEKGKTVNIAGWKDAAGAGEVILKGIDAAKK